MLADGGGTESLVVGFAGCADGIGRTSSWAGSLVLHVDTTLVRDLVIGGSLGARSSVALGTGLLATVSTIADVEGAKSLAAVSIGCVDGIGGASFSVILLASPVKAALIVELVVGTRSLGEGSSVALGTGLMAV